jgi:anti-sigma regulatory factor (Ser/Thr protein kinase)
MSTVSVAVNSADQAGEARRAASNMAAALGFDEAGVGRVAIVATECASNLWKHAAGGEILISDAECEGLPCVEMIALDNGPGMADVDRCFQDGYSTAGSAGSGLGAVGRLSQCEVYTRPNKGTAIFARLFPGSVPAQARGSRFLTGGIAVPYPGETVCGDGFAFRRAGGCMVAMMADGLGHGPSAADCAARAIGAFRRSEEEAPAKIIHQIHDALRGTRGAAVSVCLLNPKARQIDFSGIGNVLGMVCFSGGESKNFVALPGIAGHHMASVREFTYAWPVNSVVLIYSDGIGSHWSLNEYEGLALRGPSLISGVIYRDRKRGRDDASVLVIRERNPV